MAQDKTDAQILDFLAPYDPRVQEIALRLRALLEAVVAQVTPTSAPGPERRD